MSTQNDPLAIFKALLVILLLGGAFAKQLPRAAHASQINIGAKCRFYLSNAEKAPEPIEPLLRKSENGLYVCTEKSGDLISYALLMPVWRGPLGVCGYERSAPMYPQGQKHTSFPSQVFMAMAMPGACPLQDDTRYIPANGVSEGTFVQILDFFAHLNHTPGDLEKSIVPQAHQKISNDNVEEVRDLLRQGDAMVAGIRLASFSLNGGARGYEVVIRAHSSKGLILSIDLTSDGFKILDIWRILD